MNNKIWEMQVSGQKAMEEWYKSYIPSVYKTYNVEAASFEEAYEGAEKRFVEEVPGGRAIRVELIGVE